MINNKKENLIIAAWNADNIKLKKHELQQFLSENKIDIMLISETWLRAGDKLNYANYTTYREDRKDGPGGGVAILIKRTLTHDLITANNLETLEAIGIQIKIDTKTQLRIFSAYHPPAKQFHHTDYRKLLVQNIPTIIMGDLNAKNTQWGCLTTNKYGRQLSKLLDENNMGILTPGKPTFFGTNTIRPDMLDIAIYKDVSRHMELETVCDLSSDHNPIIMTIGPDIPIPTPELTKKVDWDKYKKYVHDNINLKNTLTTEQEIEESVETFTLTLTEALKNSTFPTKPKTHNTPTIPTRIKILINQKRKLQKKAQRTLNPADKTAANNLSNRVREELRKFNEEKWQERIQQLTTKDGSLWKMTKALTTKKKRNSPPIHGKNGIVYTAAEKVETFADSLEEQFTINNLPDEATEQMVEETTQIIRRAPTNSDFWTTPKDLKHVISKLHNKKAPGPDNISNISLKHLPRKAIGILTSIINACIRKPYFPLAWKKSEIILIPKPNKDPTFPQNYRPISLISAIGKLTEAIILKRLKKTTQENNIFPLEQFGFREHHSTTHQTIRIVENIQEGFTTKKSTAAIFLDIEKAFDKIWHNAVIYKLHTNGVPEHLTKLIQKFLQGRQFRVKLENQKSTWRPSAAGVPQGSLLSPILFNIYAADIPRPEGTIMGLYADDLVLMATDRNTNFATRILQNGINEIEEWYNRWKIKINATKSKAILFSKKLRGPDERITIEDTELIWEPAATYLGLEMDKKLIWKQHTKKSLQKARRQKQQLYPLINRNSTLDLKTKTLLYKSFILPVILYASPAWATISKTNISTLQSFQNITLRQIANAPWFVRNSTLHRDLKVLPIENQIKNQTQKQYDIAADHPNILLRNATTYNPDNIKIHKRPRTILLPQR